MIKPALKPSLINRKCFRWVKGGFGKQWWFGSRENIYLKRGSTSDRIGSGGRRGVERERERISPAEITTSLFLPRRRSQEGYTSRRDFLMRLTDPTTSTLRLDLHFIHFLSGLTFLPPFPSYPNRTTSRRFV